MKKITDLGEIIQLAYVPEDVDQALCFWTKQMGAGPFFLMEHVDFTHISYLGNDTPVDISVAIGYWGRMQIEIIWQHNDAPSIYTQWRKSGGEGLQHMCISTPDINEARAIAVASGAKIVQEGVAGDGTVHFFYAETGGGPGSMIEVVQLSPEIVSVFDGIREASIGWDGSNPIRYL